MIEFFQYTLSGLLGWIWFFVFIICSLACVGVVGEKESKKKQEELLARQEAAAKEEYKKAQELIEKQANSYSVDKTLDPTAKAQAAAAPAVPVAQPATPTVSEPAVPVASQPVVAEVTQPVVTEPVQPAVEVSQEQPKAPEVVVLDAPQQPVNNDVVVDNVTPIVDNTSEDAIKENDVPAVLVINDDGTSNG